MTSATPLLIVTAGLARGRSVAVTGSVTIGRDDQNTLAIADPALSRRHCVVEPGGTRLVLRDLDSRNGVFVNGSRVTEQPLADGDQIRIGDSVLLVVVTGTALHVGGPVEHLALDETSVPMTTSILVPANSRYLTAAKQVDAKADRATRGLHGLFHLSKTLQTASSLDAVHDLLLTHALEATAADIAAILMPGASSDLLTSAGIRPSTASTAIINKAAAARAMVEKVAVLASNDAAASGVTLCVPLLDASEVASVLCVASARADALTQEELELVAAIGLIGGLAIERVKQAEWLRADNSRLRSDLAVDHNLVGESAAMQSVYRFISRVAATDTTVLLCGESGTGKELVAHAIHANSARARGPLVAINCAALPDALLESELFGHERGAFTGALNQQPGRLELANRGTVFLDEVGELALALQAKLLRVLEDHVVERVGGRKGIKIDVRLITATNRNLEAAVADGSFRRDLYYRLNVVAVTIPPLRERLDDLPLLAAYFMRKHAAGCNRPVKGISPAARGLLARHDWPGNVRELSNVIERAIVLGSSEVIQPDDLPEPLLESSAHEGDADGFHGKVAASKRGIIQDALQRSGGNVAQAARDLGLQVTYLHRLIKNLGVR
jgi:two-component system, NtrC family, response regulator HydG